MRRLVVVLSSLLLISSLACSSTTEDPDQTKIVVDAGPDPKIAECTEAGYRQASDACTSGLAGDVDPNSRCGGLEGGPAAFEEGKYGEAACINAKAGLVLKCVLEKMNAQCVGKSPSLAFELWGKCQKEVDPSFKFPDDTCASTCYTKRESCESKCPTEGAKACFDCFSDCGLKDQECLDACPRAN